MKNKYLFIGAALALLPLLPFSMPWLGEGSNHESLVGPNDIMVSVFQDFNGDGVRQVATEPLIPGLTLTAYNAGNTAAAQDNVGANGNYLLTVGAGSGPHRVEVTGLPVNLQPGAVGTSTVFFASANETVAVALENPDQYSQDNPPLITTCFIEGPQPTGTGETLIRFDYDSGCFDAGIDATCDDGGTFDGPKASLADAPDIGSTFGVAYQRNTRSAFVASYMKRHTGFKENGKTGVIYRVQNPNTATPTITEYIDFDALGIPTQPLTGDPHPADNASVTDWELDNNSWDWVGKMSFGDLDISEDGETLFVVNLFDRQLYSFPAKATPYTVADAALVTAIPLPQPCGNAIDARPFGLGVYNGKVYFSMVCSGESSTGAWAGGKVPANTVTTATTPPVGNRATMDANIYEFDPGTGGVNATPVLNFPLNYGRGLAINSGYGPTSATWNPWVRNWTVFNRPPRVNPVDGTEQLVQDRSYPQPMLSDIEFDEGGNMVLGFRDRFGDQTGHLQSPPTGFTINQDPNPNNTTTPDFLNMYDGVAEGDILRACGDPLAGWTLESGGVCGGVAAPPGPNANSNGPGGGEYYSQDDYDNFHNEVTQGGMVIVPGQAEVVTIMTDPINSSTEFYDGGVVWYRNSDGQRVQNFLVFSTAVNVGDDDGPTFAKANGLGDMIALSDPTPIQIGNRIWLDNDKDGIQSPDEPGINGVLVELFININGVLTKVAETLTAADALQGDGAFKFTNSTEQTWLNGQTEVLPNTNYEIRVGLANVVAQSSGVSAFTTQDVAGDATNDNKSDLSDSDVSPSGVVAFRTGSPGENNHTLDIGVVACDLVVNSVTPGLCNPLTNAYDLDVSLTYSGGPTGEGIVISTSNGNSQTFTPSGSSGTETFTLTGLTSDGMAGIVVTAAYATTTTCTDDSDPYTAPVNCTPTCDLAITRLVVDCANGTDFTVSFEVEWDYLMAPTDMIQVSIDGTDQAPFIPVGTTGAQAFGPLPVSGPAYALVIEAAFLQNTDCATAEAIDLIACTPDCVDGTGTVGGNVFNDFDNDGADAGALEVGQANVLVEVYDCDGVLVCSTYTNADGNWACDGLNDMEDYRVEFSTPLQPYLQSSFAGDDNGTNTQFVTAPSCEVDYGVVNATDYCNENVSLLAPCYISGNNNGTEDVLIIWSYENEGQATLDKRTIATANQIASTWGLVYEKRDQKIYSAAVLKRHAGLHYELDGRGGLGAIYVTDPFSGSPNGELWLDIAADLGISVGSIGNNTARGLDNVPNNDADAYVKVGTVGIGDIDISDDGESLYVMNLFDKTLYEINIATKTLMGSFPVPDPNCGQGAFRPWAVNYHEGSVYVGLVCDASTAGKNDAAADALTNTTGRSDLSASVYRLSAGTYTSVLSFSLDYIREPVDQFNGNCNVIDGWFPWIMDNSLPPECTMFGSTSFITYPQPLFSDIEFAENGDMVLGFIDRMGLQLGNVNYGLTGTDTYSVATAGDILHACTDGSGNFNIESDACTNTGGHYLNSDSGTYDAHPDGHGEYYGGDFFHNNGTVQLPGQAPAHPEIVLGGLAVLPGSGEVVASVYDPVTGADNFNTGGVIRLSTTTGQRTVNGFQLYSASDPLTFGKGVGIGDLEIACDPLPIQIGNYVWLDTDEDGVQDACEEPVTGLPVTLYTQDDDGTLTQVDMTTTDPVTGEYYFNDVIPDTSYLIVFGNMPESDTSFNFNGVEYAVTVDDVGEGNNPILNDSDGTFEDSPLGNLPSISYSTADTTDHTLDLGLIETAVFDLALIKRLDLAANPGPFAPNSTVTFSITVYNQGDTDATDVEVKDYVPEGLSLAPASAPNWTVSVDTAILTTPFDLAAGEDLTLSISFVIDAGFMGDTLTNRAEISSFDDDNDPATDPPIDEDSTPNDNGDDPAEANTPDEFDDDGDGTPGTEDDPNDEDDYDWEGIPVVQSFDLSLIKRIDQVITPGPFTYGSEVTFEIEVKNQGSIDATDVTVADYIPEGLSLVTSPIWTVDVDTARLATPFDLAAGATETISITFTIDLDYSGTIIDNVAEITAARNALGLPDEDSTPGDNGGDDPEVDTDDEASDDGPNGDGTPDNLADADDFDLARLSIETVSLGSTVFLDNNNDGLQNGADAGIPNVEVQLFDAVTMMQVLTDADGARVLDPTAAAAVLTDADGNYIFDNLLPGDYYVVIPDSPRDTPISSNNEGIAFVETDPDDNLDNDDEGIQPGGAGTSVSSDTITLSLGGEPLNGTIAGTETAQGREQDDPFDSNGNMTLDFGFFAPVSVGDTAFVDLDGDGLQTVGEPGIGGVTVALLDSNGDTVMVDAEGNMIAGVTMTGPDGSYSFGNLPPGSYSVAFDISTADDAEFYAFTTPNAGDDADDSDNSISLSDSTAQSDPTAFLNSGEQDLTLDVGVRCALAVAVAEPFTICSTQPIDLTAGASVSPDTSATFGATWTTPDGVGDFLDAAGNVLTSPYRYGTAVTYRPASADARRGSVTLTLTTDDPAGPCEAVSSSVAIEVLQVDCGQFFWDGE